VGGTIPLGGSVIAGVGEEGPGLGVTGVGAAAYRVMPNFSCRLKRASPMRWSTSSMPKKVPAPVSAVKKSQPKTKRREFTALLY
jgi:hypothetical protein